MTAITVVSAVSARPPVIRRARTVRASVSAAAVVLLLSTTALCAITGPGPAVVVHAGCTDGGGGGCSPPVGAKWDTWAMASSTYTYCFRGCPVQWLINNTGALPHRFAGVVGVDHYWSQQGMPCIGGQPQEFQHQNALTQQWKGHFPGMRVLQYRILSAVPYAEVVHDKMVSTPDWFVRWRHQPGTSQPGNGTICYNYISACFNDPTRINNPANKCSFEIRAAAYDWIQWRNITPWYISDVIAPSLEHADGVWLDGIGPDNGAYMCAGVCCGFGANNSPQNQAEIDAHCAGQANATTAVQKYLIANGGWEAQKCYTYKSSGLPTANDSPQQCVAHLKATAAWAADHRHYAAVAAYTTRTGGMVGYDDASADGAVAAFLLMRGQHWVLGITNEDVMALATARLVTSDYGRPRGNMTAVPGTGGMVWQRVYDRATVSLNCSDFSGRFDEAAAATGHTGGLADGISPATE